MPITTEKPLPAKAIIALPQWRFAGIPLANYADAIFDFVLAIAFMRGILWPTAVGVDGIQFLGLLVAMEFFVIHSSWFVGMVMFADASRAARVVRILGVSLFYFIFAAAMALGFHKWYPVMALAGLTLNRILFVLLRDPRTMKPVDKQEMNDNWIFDLSSYLLTMLLGCVLAGQLVGTLWDSKIYSDYFVLHGNVEGTLDVPLIAGFFYFAAHGIRDLFFTGDLGTPRYQKSVTEVPGNDSRWDIHLGLWYLVWRQIGIFLGITAFATLMGVWFGILAILFVVIITILVACTQMVSIRYLQRATRIMNSMPEQVIMKVVNDPQESNTIRKIRLMTPGKAGQSDRILAIEAVKRYNVIPPGTDEVMAEVYAPTNRNDPTVIRIGQRYLCTCLPSSSRSE